MDALDIQRKGGANSRKNLSKDEATKIGKRSARASWKGHSKSKNAEDCACAHCAAKK